ncbi:MAG: undecaprenyl/decaprenyl-phosphate alpha-N-acetylglucosaminyl 1-phosphate transferase [Lentisphaerae bacterium]|nr:undecaprenyl/decaprenyl-phosphate alpha-N-acetylglucosaminyl 1-phosphate transferase [Lentisphaerota bacterium]
MDRFCDKWLIVYGVVFAGALLASALLTPVFRKLAHKTGFLDCPSNNHKGHAKATALLGGAAMFSAWMLCIAIGVAAVTCGILPDLLAGTFSAHLDGFHSVAVSRLSIVVTGAVLAVVLGLIDDKWALKAHWKFLGQFIIAVIAVVWGGVKINFFIHSQIFSIGISVFWIMLLMNSINFFDNMDGLAVGTIAIAMGFFTVIAALNNEYFYAVFCALNFGICCGFWIYNANPASIFMGDSGSHFLGYLAAVTAGGVSYFDQSFSLTRFPVLIPLLILALPLFDTAMVVIIRTINKKPFWIGDHNHISHRFVRMGLNRKTAVMLVHFTALDIALCSLPVYWGDFKTAAILLLQAFLLLVIVSILQFSLEAKKDAVEKVEK